MALQKLKENLYKNYAVYHERVSMLIELTRFEIGETSVAFTGKLVKPLNVEQALNNPLFNSFMQIEGDEIKPKEWDFSATYLFPKNNGMPLLNNDRLSRSYCPFQLWLDPELAKFVEENEDEVTRKVAHALVAYKDWRELLP